jgi:hypothetical protein
MGRPSRRPNNRQRIAHADQKAAQVRRLERLRPPIRANQGNEVQVMGRPSVYDPAFCERVIDLGKQGASVVEMACEIGVCRNTIETNWPGEHDEFLEAFTRAKLESQTWWERKGRDNLSTAGFQSSVWSRSMAARRTDPDREQDHSRCCGAER